MKKHFILGLSVFFRTCTKKFFSLLLFYYFGLSFIVAQNAIVGSGFSSGFGGGSCPTGNSNFKYLSATNFGSTYGLTTNANGTGNQYFRFGVDYSGTISQLTITPGTDVSISQNTKYTLNSSCTTSGAMYINVGSTSYNYVFRTQNAGTNPTGNFVIFEVQGTVRSVTGVSRNPTGSVPLATTTTVTATLDGALSTGQAVYLRYSTNNFATSTVVQMTGSGTTYTGTIPADPNGASSGTTVNYYTFTSGDANVASDGSNADLFTINANTNSGSNYSFVLPVKYTSFTAGEIKNTIFLKWVTAEEKDNAYFKVEHSVDGEVFRAIGEIKGAINSYTSKDYTFTDATPTTGINYYRIKDVDINGVVTTSKVVSAVYNTKVVGDKLSLSPNPAVNLVNVNFNAQAEGNATINVYDYSGRLLSSQLAHFTEGANNVNVDVVNLFSGVYIVRVNAEIQRFVKM